MYKVLEPPNLPFSCKTEDMKTIHKSHNSHWYTRSISILIKRNSHIFISSHLVQDGPFIDLLPVSIQVYQPGPPAGAPRLRAVEGQGPLPGWGSQTVLLEVSEQHGPIPDHHDDHEDEQ